MIQEINTEIIDYILEGLELLEKYSLIDGKVKINLKELSLAFNNSCPEEWVYTQMERIFSNGTKLLSKEYLTDAKKVMEVLENYDHDVAYEYFCEFLVMYGYECSDQEKLHDNKKYQEDLDEYYKSLDFVKAEFYCPLVTTTSTFAKLSYNIASLLENTHCLYNYALLDVDLVYSEKYKTNIVEVYMVFERGSSLSDDLCVEELLQSFKFVIDENLNQLKS